MIFYFSGTGNSQYAASQLLSEGEKLVPITNHPDTHSYVLRPEEELGFVFPVYFYTVPSIVRDFINNLHVENVTYTYAAITCGGSISQAGSVLKKLLRKQGIRLDYVKELLMPDNSMLFYQIPSVGECSERLYHADGEIAELKCDIHNHRMESISDFSPISDITGKLYEKCRSTAGFHAEDNCIGCGICASNCPEQAIELINRKPNWIRDSCCKCSKCINRCPVQAIQYGKHTKKRNRYVNPNVT